MKSTDEMILDLHEKAGFVLPEGLRLTDNVGWVIGKWAAFSQRKARDLCAMEYARQAYKRKGESEQMFDAWLDCVTALAKGDSAAAIRTLWKGVCDGV